MRFLPHTPADISRMLEVVGLGSTDGLFAQVPQALRDSASLDLPDGLGEDAVLAAMAGLAGLNQTGDSFQGAGAYRHFVPAAVSQVLSRSEFATAYTPYQPEVSQGTLQACFEFQTYVSILTGLPVANASLYDGASALAEAVLMALRVGKRRRRVLISRAVHPQYREVVGTYLAGSGEGEIEELPIDGQGRTDLGELAAMLDDEVAAVCVGYPNYLGVIDDLAAASEAAAKAGALTISVTTEALALGLLRSPGELGADVAVAEGQSLGLPMAYGGPGLGMFAAREPFLRQVPGRLVGQTVDQEGCRGYVLTLATREQHIRREKATSNICTNQGLATLAVTAYLGLTGRRGLRELALLNTARAHEVAGRLKKEAGLAPLFEPFFNEFVVAAPGGQRWFDETVASGLVPGVRLAGVGSEPEGRLLVTVTETTRDSAVDRLVAALAGGPDA